MLWRRQETYMFAASLNNWGKPYFEYGRTSEATNESCHNVRFIVAALAFAERTHSASVAVQLSRPQGTPSLRVSPSSSISAS
jgi:hypothetical protein